MNVAARKMLWGGKVPPQSKKIIGLYYKNYILNHKK
jgi:hypothetical protein